VLSASRAVDASPETVFSLLSDLPGHWQLADHFTQVVELDAHGGVIRLCGPLGLRRTARVRLVRSEPPLLLVGEAHIGRRTLGRVRWELESVGDGTEVTLSAEILRAGPGDHLLLALGGRRWLHRRLAATLDRLATVLSDRIRAAEPG
jgi:hypothetical protein